MTRDEMMQWKEHQERLYAMAVDDGETWDLSDNDQAACNAGGDAILALLRATPTPVAAPPADLVVITDEQAKALDVIAATEDGIGQVADSIFAISNIDVIGWSEGGELRAHAMTLRDELAKVLAAYKVLYPLREAHELAEVPDER